MAKQTVNIDVQVQSKSLGQLEDELKDINEQLREVEVGSDAFNSLAREAQNVTKELDQANKAIEGFTAEDKFMAADGSIKLMGGSLSSVVGTLGLFGVESEVFGDFERKAASAIAVATGFKDVSEGIRQIGPAFQKSGIAAKLFGSTTSKALIATGVGAFVVALGAIVANWDSIVNAVQNFIDKSEGLQNFIGKIKAGFNQIFESVRPVLEFFGLYPTLEEQATEAARKGAEERAEAIDKELKLAQARGASARELAALEEEMLQKRIEGAKNEEELKKANFQMELFRAKEQKRIKDEQLEEDRKWYEEQKRLRDEANQQEVLDAEEQAYALEMAVASGQQKAQEELAPNFQAYNEAILEEEDMMLEELLAGNKRLVESEKATQEKIKEARQEGLTALQQFASMETGIGRALIIAKQVQLAKELFLEAKKTITFSAQAAARSKVAVTEGTAQTAKIGFPQNIPLLLAYGIQAASIIGTIKQAVGAAKGSTAGLSFDAPSQAPQVPQAQNVNITNTQEVGQELQATNQQTVKAYVVSGDVRSSQEADAKIASRRTLD